VSAPHFVIAGAGIGGLTMALSLARRGIAATVVEKRTGFGETGAGLQVTSNSGRVLDALDLALPLKRISVTSHGLMIRRWADGSQVLEMPSSPEHMPTPFRMMKRNDLHTVLLDAARAMPNIRLMVGRSVDEVSRNADGVTIGLTARDGVGGTLSALGLIGADGLWSRVRDLTGDASPPVFTGYEAWRAVAPARAGDKPRVTLHMGSGRHAVHYPVAGGKEINIVVVRQAKEAREGWSRDGDLSILTEHLAGASQPLRELTGAAEGWQVWSLFDRKPAAMAKGRVALLGDAFPRPGRLARHRGCGSTRPPARRDARSRGRCRRAHGLRRLCRRPRPTRRPRAGGKSEQRPQLPYGLAAQHRPRFRAEAAGAGRPAQSLWLAL